MNARRFVVGSLISLAVTFAAPVRADFGPYAVDYTDGDGRHFAASVLFTPTNGFLNILVTNLILLDEFVFSGQAVSTVGFSIFNNGTELLPNATSLPAILNPDPPPATISAGGDRPSTLVTGSLVSLKDGQLTSVGVNTPPPATDGAAEPWTYGANPVSGFPSSAGSWQLTALVGSFKNMIAPTTPLGDDFCVPTCPSGIDAFTPYYNGSATFSLAITGITENSTIPIEFVSIGWGTSPTAGGDEPDIGIVPIPAAVWLFGSGLLGLIGIARRKRSVISKA